MSLEKVFLKPDVYLVCLNHALSTEREEIMGLLLGHVEQPCSPDLTNHANGRHLFIESIVILQRSVRQADRVEISPLQLTAATQTAENLSLKLGKPIRVLGWYHSHPHITVQPSHVDVQTQANYQAMDPDFIGLIFSVFQHDANEKFANVSIICFQAVENNGVLSSKEIFINSVQQCVVSEHCIKALAEIPATLCNEEQEAMKQACHGNSFDTISKLHNTAVFTQSLCQIVECCEIPCISGLKTYEQALMKELQTLKVAKNKLISEISVSRKTV